MVACRLNIGVGNSSWSFERWSVARIDGAYPRRERRGIAPVPRITECVGISISGEGLPQTGSLLYSAGEDSHREHHGEKSDDYAEAWSVRTCG